MKNRKYNIKALCIATLLSILMIVLVFYGSRKLQNFDAALVTYLFGTVFAFFGIVYRYTIWLQRPPTWIYFKRGICFLFTGKVFSHFWFASKETVSNIVFQKFIYPRGKYRWFAHFMIAVGCTSAFFITIPLTFGWVHFTMAANSITVYEAHFFGFKIMEFDLDSIMAFMTFHALNWSSYMVIFGAGYYLRRRLTNPGLIATQTFEGDLLPLILLIAISVTGLGLTYSYEFMKGLAFDFLAVLHAVTVILFLIWVPFGKFFHIIQRPAQIAAHIYHRVGRQQGMAICEHTGEEFTTNLHVKDLKMLTKELGFNFDRKDGTSHLDLSPEGKRARLAQAHLRARQEGGNLFG